MLYANEHETQADVVFTVTTPAITRTGQQMQASTLNLPKRVLK